MVFTIYTRPHVALRGRFFHPRPVCLLPLAVSAQEPWRHLAAKAHPNPQRAELHSKGHARSLATGVWSEWSGDLPNKNSWPRHPGVPQSQPVPQHRVELVLKFLDIPCMCTADQRQKEFFGFPDIEITFQAHFLRFNFDPFLPFMPQTPKTIEFSVKNCLKSPQKLPKLKRKTSFRLLRH